MRILTRYLLRELVVVLLLCICAGTTLYLVIDAFDFLERLIRFGATFRLAVLFMFYKIPFIVHQTLPAAMLLSVMLTLGNLSRHNEILAVRFSGISIFRIVIPMLLVSVVVGIGAFLLNEFLVPPTRHKSESIYLTQIRGIRASTQVARDCFWYKSEQGLYKISSFNPKTKELQGVTLFIVGERVEIVRRIDAEAAVWDGQGWLFRGVSVHDFGPKGLTRRESYPERYFDIPEVPKDFQEIQKAAGEMSMRQLGRIIRKVKKQGYDPTHYLVDYHAKMSFSLLNVLTVFIGIPFALRTSKQGGLIFGIVVSMVIALGFWTVFALSLSLGRSGLVPPMISAWMANVLFSIVGIIMLARIER